MGWREQLNSVRAVIIKRGVNPLGEAYIVRMFPAINVQSKDACIVGLGAYADPKNSNPSSFVVDPWADGEPQVGTWYGGEINEDWGTPDPSNGRESLVLNLTQLLTKGLSAAVKSAVTVEDTCRYSVTRTEFRSMINSPTVPPAAAGMTYRLLDLMLDDKTGFWRGYLETRTRKTQQVAAYNSRLETFSTLQRQADLGITDAAAAALIPSSQTAGTVKDVRRERNEDCTNDVEQAIETAVAGTEMTQVIEAGDSSLARTRLVNQTDQASAPVAADGTVKTLVETKNRFQRYDQETTTETAKDQSIAMPAAVTDVGNVSKSPRMQSRTQILSNSASAPTALGAEEQGEVSYRKNRFNLFDGIKTITTWLDTITIPGWELGEQVKTATYIERVQRGKQFYKREITFTVKIRQTNNHQAAINYAYASGALMGTEIGSSRYESLSNGQYKSYWIGDRTPGSWTTDGTALPI